MTWEIEASLTTDRGCVRAHNEDSGQIVRPHDRDALASRGVLALIADGMGGHSGGEIASRIATEVMTRRYYDVPGDPSAALAHAVRDANAEIFARASATPELDGMGTTCVALALCGDLAYAAHVGDSRLYLVRAGGIYQMTTDDSAVSEMVSRGLITREEARRHADKNVILKALGTHPDVEASVWAEPLPVRSGDVFILCSDGLSDLVEDAELADVLARAPAVEDGSQALVSLAKERGGFDNITAAVLRVSTRAAATVSPRETRAIEVRR